jgi:hypothetical protein
MSYRHYSDSFGVAIGDEDSAMYGAYSNDSDTKRNMARTLAGWPLPALVDRSFKFLDRKAFKKTNPWTRFARFSLFFWI